MTVITRTMLVAVISLALTPIAATDSKEHRIVFEGKILAIGPSPGYGSGGVQAYQLVKYQIKRVCEGAYEGEEMIVDHLLLDPDELNALKIGNRVCVGVTKAKEMTSRWNDGQLRLESDRVTAYYVAHDVLIRNCRCSR